MLAGVARQIGDALLLENSKCSGQVISIGIVPCGIVEKRHNLNVPLRYGILFMALIFFQMLEMGQKHTISF
jgi:hypothetical protein